MDFGSTHDTTKTKVTGDHNRDRKLLLNIWFTPISLCRCIAGLCFVVVQDRVHRQLTLFELENRSTGEVQYKPA